MAGHEITREKWEEMSLSGRGQYVNFRIGYELAKPTAKILPSGVVDLIELMGLLIGSMAWEIEAKKHEHGPGKCNCFPG